MTERSAGDLEDLRAPPITMIHTSTRPQFSFVFSVVVVIIIIYTSFISTETMGIHNNDNLVPKDITDANLDTVMDTAIVEDRRFDLAVDADEWLCGDTSLLVDIMHDVLEHNPNNRMIMVFGGGADPYKAIEHLCRAVRKYTNRTLDSNAQTNYYKNGISDPEHQQLLQKYREHVGDEQTKYSLLLKLYAEKHFAGRVRVLSALKEADAMTK